MEALGDVGENDDAEASVNEKVEDGAVEVLRLLMAANHSVNRRNACRSVMVT